MRTLLVVRSIQPIRIAKGWRKNKLGQGTPRSGSSPRQTTPCVLCRGLLSGVSNTGDGLEIKWIVPDYSPPTLRWPRGRCTITIFSGTSPGATMRRLNRSRSRGCSSKKTSRRSHARAVPVISGRTSKHWKSNSTTRIVGGSTNCRTTVGRSTRNSPPSEKKHLQALTNHE